MAARIALALVVLLAGSACKPAPRDPRGARLNPNPHRDQIQQLEELVYAEGPLTDEQGTAIVALADELAERTCVDTGAQRGCQAFSAFGGQVEAALRGEAGAGRDRQAWIATWEETARDAFGERDWIRAWRAADTR